MTTLNFYGSKKVFTLALAFFTTTTTVAIVDTYNSLFKPEHENSLSYTLYVIFLAICGATLSSVAAMGLVKTLRGRPELAISHRGIYLSGVGDIEWSSIEKVVAKKHSRIDHIFIVTTNEDELVRNAGTLTRATHFKKLSYDTPSQICFPTLPLNADTRAVLTAILQFRPYLPIIW